MAHNIHNKTAVMLASDYYDGTIDYLMDVVPTSTIAKYYDNIQWPFCSREQKLFFALFIMAAEGEL